MNLTERDLKRLEGVHPDLVLCVKHAATFGEVDFMIIEGVRTLAKQREYFNAGKSKTMRSRHLDGHAVDVAPLVDLDADGDLDLTWEVKHFKPIVAAFKEAIDYLGIPLEFGGEWKTFKDWPHIQLPRSRYP
jgi:peptidoglycan L-alanyl-D-glutamate endopeptidase CwlK